MKMIQIYIILDGVAIPQKYIQTKDIINVMGLDSRIVPTHESETKYEYYYLHYTEPYTYDMSATGVYNRQIIIGFDYYSIPTDAPVIRKEDFEAYLAS